MMCGQLLYVNAPDGAPAPRFFLGRTRAGSIWRFRHDLPEDVSRRLEALCASEPAPTDLREAPRYLKSLECTLEGHEEIQRQWIGPAYCFPRDIHHSENIVRITRENAALLEPCFGTGFTSGGSSSPVSPQWSTSGPCPSVAVCVFLHRLMKLESEPWKSTGAEDMPPVR